MTKLPTPEQFLADFMRDLKDDREKGAQNQTVILKGYASLMRSREQAIRKEGAEDERINN